jgi:hypothetical protein
MAPALSKYYKYEFSKKRRANTQMNHARNHQQYNIDALME